MQNVNVCCLTKFSFDLKGSTLYSDGFLGRREWGLFGIPWEAMDRLMVVGFRAVPAQQMPYSHDLPPNVHATIVGPERGTGGSRVARGLGELWGILRDIYRRRAMLKDLDIVFSEFREYAFFEIALIKLFARKAKVVVFFISDFPESNYSRHHNIIFKWMLAALVSLCQLLADDVWFISEHLERKYCLASTKRFGVVRPSNLEAKEIAPVGALPRHMDKSVVRLIYVSRLEKEKRPEVALAVVKLLVEAGVRVELSFVGDGAMRGQLERQAETLGIAREVRFLGYIPDRTQLLKQYGNADLSLLASAHEGLGLVLVESISQGVPAIANHFEGAEEIIRDGIDGYLVSAPDAAALAQGIATKIQHLAEHPKDYEMLSANGPEGAERFTLEAANAVQRTRMETLLQ